MQAIRFAIKLAVSFNLIRSLIFLHSSLYFYSLYLLTPEGTSVKYLFLFISSMYTFILLIIRYKGFTLFVTA